ncbi:MAG TPA: hypothetical protein VGD33_05310, partial [Chitinophagaceae bacterium]
MRQKDHSAGITREYPGEETAATQFSSGPYAGRLTSMGILPGHLIHSINIQVNAYTTLIKILTLHITTIVPNKIKEAFLGSFPASKAERGAAIMPPMISARITCQCCTPIIIKKLKALANVTKNSVRLTEPTTKRGVLPLVMSVADTIGPHPPPPKE